MQTFLPYDDFQKCAQCLDRQRLGKQRVEVLQIMNAINGLSGKGWMNHPATLMWKNHKDLLMIYGVSMCSEWIKRGYKDTCLIKIIIATGRSLQEMVDLLDNDYLVITNPKWLGDERLHSSHREALLVKDKHYYKSFNWPEQEEAATKNWYNYFWPSLSIEYGGQGDGYLNKTFL